MSQLRIPMIADGNSFFRAISVAYYNDVEMHRILRQITMDHMMEDASIFEPLFESKDAFERRVTANKCPGTWNVDLGDVIPAAVAKLLQCCIEIYSVEDIFRYRFGDKKIRLLQRKNHYDLLKD